MKKKQLAKLKQQFRPSFEKSQQLLFAAIEKKTAEKYDLITKVFINPKNHAEMIIELLAETSKEPRISVPLDENFTVVVKRIQKQEAGLLERFSDNLVEEIAAYWLGAKLDEAAPVQQSEKEQSIQTPNTDKATEKSVKAAEVAKNTEAAPAAAEKPAAVSNNQAIDTLSQAAFEQAMIAFPKFSVQENRGTLQVIEKSGKEDRLLAEISQTQAGHFTIAPALERKYKLKLEVIPLIEAFANTPLEQR